MKTQTFKKKIALPPLILLILTLLITVKKSFSQKYFTVEVKGTGKPMILIHGIYCTGDVWKETVKYYEKKYECHVITLAGFGGTTPHTTETIFLTQ